MEIIHFFSICIILFVVSAGCTQKTEPTTITPTNTIVPSSIATTFSPSVLTTTIVQVPNPTITATIDPTITLVVTINTSSSSQNSGITHKFTGELQHQYFTPKGIIVDGSNINSNEGSIENTAESSPLAAPSPLAVRVSGQMSSNRSVDSNVKVTVKFYSSTNELLASLEKIYPIKANNYHTFSISSTDSVVYNKTALYTITITDV